MRALDPVDGYGRPVTINLNQLATFVQLAEKRNFTRTADALHLTQPAVTQQIRALERDLGVALVDIVARRTEITEIGALVAERGEVLLNQVDTLRRDVRELAEARSGVVHVGATVTIGGYVLPGLLARFAARYPGIRVEVAVENTTTIVPMVADGRVGLALVEGDVAEGGLEVVPFADDELVLIVGDSHRLANHRSVAPSALADEPFITREDGSGTRELFERAMRAAGIAPRIVLALPTGEGIVRAVRCGLGIAMISRLVAADAIGSGVVKEVEVHGVELRRKLFLVRRGLRTRSPAARAFAELVLEGAASTLPCKYKSN